MIQPFHNIDAINAICNHASLRDAVLLGQSADIDVGPLLDSGRAVFLGDDQGGFLCYREADGVWSIHTQFLPKARGPSVAIKAASGSKWLFQNTDATSLTTFVEHGNSRAKALSLALGFTEVAEAEYFGRAGLVLSLSIKEWVRKCL